MPRISYRECFDCVGFREVFCCLAFSEIAGFDTCSKVIWPEFYDYPRFPFKKRPPEWPKQTGKHEKETPMKYHFFLPVQLAPKQPQESLPRRSKSHHECVPTFDAGES